MKCAEETGEFILNNQKTNSSLKQSNVY